MTLCTKDEYVRNLNVGLQSLGEEALVEIYIREETLDEVWLCVLRTLPHGGLRI